MVFERLNYCSNKSAHKEVIRLRKRNYIMTKEWPSDANKKTALVLCFFFGLFGAHNFYLGRFFKAMTVLFGTVCSMILLFLPYGTVAYNVIRYISVLPAASVLVFWVLDFVKIFLETYKIPVSIDEKLYAMKDQVVIETPAENKTENVEENKDEIIIEEIEELNNNVKPVKKKKKRKAEK